MTLSIRPRTGLATILLSTLLGLPHGAHAQSGPAPSFDPDDQPPTSSDVDAIDPYTGQLAFSVPVGQVFDVGPGLRFQVQLHYSSRVWAPGTWTLHGVVYEPYMLLQGDPALGPGWRFSMGQIVESSAGVPSAYLAPNGSAHQLFSQRFSNVSSEPPGFFYTRDGSYIRVKYVNATAGYQMWTAEGNLTTFGQKVTGYDDAPGNYSADFGRGRNGWHATSIANPYGDAITITYQSTQSSPSTYPWVPAQISIPAIGSSGGPRVITVSMSGPRISSISVPAWGSLSNAVYTLGYTGPMTLPRPTSWPTSSTGQVYQLESVRYPTTGSYTMEHSFTYFGTPPQSPYAAGALATHTIPTGAVISYGYGTWSFYHANVQNMAATCVYPPEALVPTVPMYRTGDGIEPNLPALGSCIAIDRNAGVVKRAIDASDSITRYYQYNFPFGETGLSATAQTETLIVSPPDSATAPKRHSTTYLFTASTSQGTTGPFVGGLTRVAVFSGDVSGGQNGYGHFPSPGPVCNNALFCTTSSATKRVTKLVYETDSNDPDLVGVVDNRRISQRITSYNPDSVSPGKYRKVDYVWDQNSGRYGTETYSDTIQSSTETVRKVIQTVYTPVKTSTEWKMDVPTSVVLKPTATGAAFKTVTNTPDSHGFIRATSTADGSGASGGTLVHEFTFDTHGLPSTETFTLGASSYTTTLTWASGALKTSQAGGGITWKSVDDEIDPETGLVSKAYDPNRLQSGGGQLYTTFTYDVLGRPLVTTPPNGEAITTITYDSPTQVTSVTVLPGAAGTEVSWTRAVTDNRGRLLRTLKKLPGGGIPKKVFSYDDQGNRTFESEWLPESASELTAPGTTWEDFDDFGRPRKVTKADGQASTISYADPANSTAWPASVWYSKVTIDDVSGASSATEYTADGFGRLLSVKEPVNQYTTTYTYDLQDNVTGVTQGQQTRTFLFDAFGFLRRETTPERSSQVVTYTYDPLGNVLTRTEPGSVGISWAYDGAGRPTEISSTTGDLARYLVNCYDGGNCPDGAGASTGGSFPLGKLTTRRGFSPNFGSPAPRVQESFDYSEATGRLSARTTTITNLTGVTPPATTERWFYDKAGEIVRYDYPRSSGLFAVTTGYDYGLPTVLAANGIPVATATYHTSGALAGYTTGTGVHPVSTTIAYDAANRIPRPSRISTSGALQGGVAFNFDTGAYSYDGAGNIESMGSDSFDYDADSRLTQATIGGVTQMMSYDRYGSLLSKTGGPGSVTYTVNSASNRLLSGSYDLRGNLTQSPAGEIFTYDSLSRVARSQSGAYLWKYVFNGANERVVKVPPSGTSYFYTFRDPAHRIVTEYQGGAVSRDNIYLGNLLVASYSSCALNGQPGWQYYSSDHLGTPRLVTDVNGNVLESRKYWPFGEPLSGSGSSLQRTRFAAMELDQEESASRYYVHARSLDYASVGRFLSPDPVLGNPFEPQSWNRYGYARNNPLAFVDPDGLDPVPGGVPTGPVPGGVPSGPVPGSTIGRDSPTNPSFATWDSREFYGDNLESARLSVGLTVTASIRGADIIYFMPGAKSGTQDDMRLKGAWEAWVPSGAFLVAAHANSVFLANQRDKEIRVELLAERIRRHPNYRPGMDVYLGGCNLAKTDGAYAQRLALLLRARVWAATENVNYSSDGRMIIRSWDGHPGEWKPFGVGAEGGR